MFRRLVAGRLKLEYAYYNIVNDVRSFIEIWCVNEVLCTIYDDVIVLNLIFFLYTYVGLYVLILLCND